VTGPTTDAVPTPDLIKNFGVLAQYCSDIWVRMANQTATAVTEAADELGTGTHTVDDCYQTMTKLANIAFLGWTEIFTSVAAGAGFQTVPALTSSNWYPVPGDQSCAHRVTVGPLSRSVSDDPITKLRLGLEAQRADKTVVPCLDWVLPAGTTQFRLVVSQLGLHSGCYAGKADIAPIPTTTGAAPPSTQLDVEVDI
jgi:hypothetical protein